MVESYKLMKKKKTLYTTLILVVFFAVLIWSVYGVLIRDTNWSKIGSAKEIWEAVTRFFPPAWEYTLKLAKPTLDTFLIAVLGTFIALIISVPVAWFAARNFTPFFPVTYPLGRFIMTISRSVHEIVWALIFVAAVGLGPFAGIIALGMRSVGFTSKLTAEQIENIDYRPIEAIRAVGGSPMQVFFYATIPQVLPQFIGTAIFQWDINIRRATIIGIVGGGGLGLVFSQKMASYQYTQATACLLAILILVLIGEYTSTRLRTLIQ